MSGATTAKDLRELVAQAIEDAGLGTYATTYTGSESWPIHFRKTPATPDVVLTVSLYSVGRPHLLGVQVRVRGGRNKWTQAEDQAQAVITALHAYSGSRGSTQVELVTYQSTAPLGFDSLGREELAVNFHALLDDAAGALYHD